MAAEQVILSSGFRIRAERHEATGDVVKIFTGQGVIELNAASVAFFEAEDPAPVQRPAPVTPPASPSAPQRPAPASATANPKELLKQAAERYGLPPEFLQSVARTESAFRLDAVSPKGAIGLMQLMPGTAASLSANPYDPEQNIDAGARHLRDLLLQYEGSTHKALAAYNAGQGAVQRYGGVPPYSETRNYVEKVLENYQKLTSAKQPN